MYNFFQFSIMQHSFVHLQMFLKLSLEWVFKGPMMNKTDGKDEYKHAIYENRPAPSRNMEISRFSDRNFSKTKKDSKSCVWSALYRQHA